MKHVFISYVSENRKEVQRLASALKRNGVEVWLDRDKLKPGDHWKDEIRKAIRSGTFFIACFSKEYSQRSKTYMNEELNIAIEELRQSHPSRRWFIPVMLSECEVPEMGIGRNETLLDIQQVSLYEDFDEGLKQILSVIKEVVHKKIVLKLQPQHELTIKYPYDKCHEIMNYLENKYSAYSIMIFPKSADLFVVKFLSQQSIPNMMFLGWHDLESTLNGCKVIGQSYHRGS